ncbi:MAG: hypothetical protein GX663_05195 [Clostridiales bacterium]|nr:hypothetical protein [Clostridiales bacterium]
MDYGILACVPIAVLIIGLLITKRMVEMIVVSTIIGAIIVYRSNVFDGYIELCYGALTNSSFQFLILLLLGFGGMIKLFEKSGAFQGFSNIISKFANTPKKSMVATWIMGILVFVDDYLNVLSVSFAMKDITDKHGIPREHLAYGVNSMGACVCVLIPFTSWAAFAIGVINEQGLGFTDYVRALPYMFFPIIAILLCLLVAVGIVPKVGPIKKAYERVASGGSVMPSVQEEGGTSFINMESSDEGMSGVKPTSPLNFFIPIIVLIIVMLLCNNDVIHGIYAAIIVQLILYLAQRIMTLAEFVDAFLSGITGMASLSFIIMFAYVLSAENDALGFAPYIIDKLTQVIPPTLLPMIAFITVAFVAFAAGSFWILIVITVPIFVPLAASMGMDPVIVVAAIMSGVAFGSKICFYSDAVFMTSAGTGVSNMTQIKAIAPYVLGSAALAAICFAIVGFVTA